jgi:hypothetical protein
MTDSPRLVEVGVAGGRESAASCSCRALCLMRDDPYEGERPAGKLNLRPAADSAAPGWQNELLGWKAPGFAPREGSAMRWGSPAAASKLLQVSSTHGPWALVRRRPPLTFG